MNQSLKRELRTFAGARSIREAKRLFGIRDYTNDRAYRYLLKLYEPVQRQRRLNEVVRRNTIRNRIIQQQQLKLQRQRQIFQEAVQRRRRRNAVSVEDWFDRIRQQMEGRFNTPFRLRIRSAIINGLELTLTFSNIYKFQKWVDRIMDDQVGGDSETVITYRDVMNDIDNKDAMKLAFLEILPVQGGCNKQKVATTGGMLGDYYKFQYYNPSSQYNNCGLACLEYFLQVKFKYSAIRKQYNLKSGDMITPKQLAKIYVDNGGSKVLSFIADDFCADFKKEYNYIHIRDNHYRVITGGVPKAKVPWEEDVEGKKKFNKVRRKLLAYDFETRPIDPTNVDTNKHRFKTGQTYRYQIKDAICSIHYETTNGVETKTFITNYDKSSARYFIEWLAEQHKRNIHYLVVAHNGSRFDNLLLQAEMNEAELQHLDPQYRGYSLIGMNFYNHVFRDPCCFLVGSLDTLCKNFKVVNAKKTTDIYKGMDNKQLCFYREELTLNEFLELQHKEPKYWEAYVDYCEVDCISLMELWKKFCVNTNGLIKKMGTYTDKSGKEQTNRLVGQVSVNSSTTIGGLAKRIIDALNPAVSKMRINPMEKYLKFIGDDDIKYEYVCKFKRGGISHCNQAGRHDESVAGIDITSQYPTALKYMIIPSGESEWVKEYSPSRYGYYTIKNLKWDNDRKFRPVCKYIDCKNGESLNWTTNWEEDTITYVDSEMLKYCVKYLGLVSFDVIEGLVSNYYVKGQELFGKYVDVLFAEKAYQDELKKNSPADFNNAYREVCKLFMNSLTGKLVEDPSKYFQLKFSMTPVGKKDNINGVGFVRDMGDEPKKNLWVNAGVMVYSYSKRILWEYVRFLPDQSNDIIHIETDGLYFPARYLPALEDAVSKENYKGDYANAIGFGSDLGNVKVEHKSAGPSYWLGKKFYYMYCGLDNVDVIKIKGVPMKTIDAQGTTKQIIDKSVYEDVYAGNKVSKSFNTLYKNVFGKIEISSLNMTRTISPMCDYKVYD
jgi:hypothetical protein